MYPDRIIRGINWRQVGISSNCVTEGNAYGRDKSNVFYLIDEYYFFFVPAARGLTTRMSVMRLTSVFFFLIYHLSLPFVVIFILIEELHLLQCVATSKLDRFVCFVMENVSFF
jgi:hypothetical protein